MYFVVLQNPTFPVGTLLHIRQEWPSTHRPRTYTALLDARFPGQTWSTHLARGEGLTEKLILTFAMELPASSVLALEAEGLGLCLEAQNTFELARILDRVPVMIDPVYILLHATLEALRRWRRTEEKLHIIRGELQLPLTLRHPEVTADDKEDLKRALVRNKRRAEGLLSQALHSLASLPSPELPEVEEEETAAEP